MTLREAVIEIKKVGTATEKTCQNEQGCWNGFKKVMKTLISSLYSSIIKEEQHHFWDSSQ